ncbi:autotransporter domain-containing protein [Herbaspirillum sp. RV1423]|uniref:autotransporter outer membrane beta-barrel domain-containing protein n=1 Tax=Herbaspirillum sp. RV1423 TaxID=1443993 RepID=UPI0004B077F2|nr:autotransporter domain-containing protein [Herbaspirillum sp. RV1423]
MTATGTVGTLNNAGAIISAVNHGVDNTGTMTSFINSGYISGVGAGISNTGTIGTLTNTGTINGTVSHGIDNSGTMSSLVNSGYIAGASTGIYNANGTIGSLTNSGTIVGGIYNGGTITALTNSGLIRSVSSGSSALAFVAGSSIGSLTNTGTIASDINNSSTQALTINGGSGATFGTLTGFNGGIGAIHNTSSNVVFASGNQYLNDNIDVGTHTVSNLAGALQVNNTITITGNYVQAAGANLLIGVANGAIASGVVGTDSGYGRLVATGNATFDAGSSVVLKPITTYSFAQGQKFVVVQAATANYNAGALNYSATGYDGVVTGASVVDSGNAALTDLILTLGARSSGSTSPILRATSNDAVSSLNGLFRYNGTDANVLNMYNAAVALGSTAEANRAGAQLSPAANTASAIQSAQVTTQAVLNVTSSHVDTLRTAQASGSGVSTGERASDIALWGQAFGGQANQGNRAAGSGYRAGYSGLLIGADTALNDQWRVGGVFSYADTSVNSGGDNTGSSAHIKGYGLTGYGGYTAESWYLNLSGGIVRQKYNTLRNVSYTGFSGNAAGQFDGTQYVASVQAGYPIKLDAMTTLTPIAGLTYSRMTQDAYTETGSVAALRVNSGSTSSLKSDLGAKLERSFKTSFGEITPSAQLSWRHEYRDTSVQSVANFAADTSGATSFTTQGAAANTNTGVLVLGATLARSQNLTLAARYTLEAARGYTAQTADVRLRYQF